MFLGIDASLASTGLCLLADSHTFDSKTVKTKNTKGMNRLLDIIDTIKEYVGGNNDIANFAAIEGYSMASRGKNYHLGELGGLIRWHLVEWNIPFIVVPPQSRAKFATKNGNADKVDVCSHLRDWGADFLRDDWTFKRKGCPMPPTWGTQDSHWRNDEADAYVLASIAAAYNNQWDRTPNREQLAILEMIRLDPMGELSAKAKEKLL